MITHLVTTLAASGLTPPRGAVVGILALVALVVLDRIPLSAYRPRADDSRTPRPRRRRQPRVRIVREHPPTTIVRRLDRPAITAGRPSQRKELP